MAKGYAAALAATGLLFGVAWLSGSQWRAGGVVSPSAQIPPPPAGPARRPVSGIWLSRREIAVLPMRGGAWAHVKATADGPLGAPGVSDQVSLHDTTTLAIALVAARTRDPRYRGKAANAIMSAIGTEHGPLKAGSRILPLARNIGSYVLAADLIDLHGYDAERDSRFRAWLQELRTRPYDGKTLIGDHETNPTNHGTMAGASRVAIAAYLGDTADLERSARVFKGWLGDVNSHVFQKFPPRSATFMPDPAVPRPVNPPGATKRGRNVDGILPAEWARCGQFRWPPCYTYYAWGGLSGAVVQAEILHRAGYDAWQWEGQALRRAYERLDFMAKKVQPVWWKEATVGDDSWQPWLVNCVYGARLPATSPSRPGKNMGWMDWTHARRTVKKRRGRQGGPRACDLGRRMRFASQAARPRARGS